MRAMLARVSPVEARPVNSSVVFGGLPRYLHANRRLDQLGHDLEPT
jgi:hypothetical protein